MDSLVSRRRAGILFILISLFFYVGLLATIYFLITNYPK